MSLSLMLVVLGAAQHQLMFTADTATGCGTQANFERAVAERLGYSPFVAEGPSRMSVRFRKEGAQRVAELKVMDGDGEVKGERSLTSSADDCGELMLATALAAALAVDPMLLTRAPEPPKNPVEPPEPQLVLPNVRAPVTQAPVRSPPLPPEAVLEPTGRMVVSLGPGAAFGQVPTVMVQATADVAWEWKWVGVGARASFTAPASLTLSQGTVAVSAATFGTLLCVGSRWGACFTAQLGVLSSAAADVPKARSANTFTSSLGLQPYVDIGFADAWRVRLQLAAQANPAVTVLYVGST